VLTVVLVTVGKVAVLAVETVVDVVMVAEEKTVVNVVTG
jgi:hypothetical protein